MTFWMYWVIADAESSPPGRAVSAHASQAEAVESMHDERVRLQARPADAGFNWEPPAVDLAVVRLATRMGVTGVSCGAVPADLEQSVGTAGTADDVTLRG